MTPQQARRSERIDYSAEVELLAPIDSAHVPRRVLAQAVDLGAGGMRVDAPAAMPIGAQVTCRVMLDGKPASLPGRVAWRSDTAAHGSNSLHGMGICFEPLGTYERGLLKHLVERSVAGYRAVELLFPGLDEPVVARARTRTNGLRLSAALPIFARGTELSFQLDAEGPVLIGRIGQAVLQEDSEGTRRIDVEVDVVEPEETGRYRRRARYGYAPELELEVESRSDADAQRALAPTEPGLRAASRAGARARRVRRAWWQTLAAATAGGALAWFVATTLQRPVANEAAADTLFVAHPRVPEQDAPRTSEVAPPAPSPSASANLAASPSAVEAPATEPAEPLPQIVTDPPKSIAPVAAAHKAPRSQPRSVSATAPADTLPEIAPEASSGATEGAPIDPSSEELEAQPETVLEGDATRVRVPFEGDLEGMRSVLWADPLALAIDLPHGSSVLAEGSYPIGAGGVTELRVNKHGDTLLIRVKLSLPIGRYAITAENGTLEARLIQLAKMAH